jgi:cytochrome c peroxidase
MMAVRRKVMLLALLGLAGCDDDGVAPPPVEPGIDLQLRRSMEGWGVVSIGAMPAQPPAQVALGRALFFDKILSGNRDIACATCHDPAAALGDGLSLAVGTGGHGAGAARTLGSGRTFVPRNAPSLLNAGIGLFQMFWDARLTGHAQGPFTADPWIDFPAGLPNLLAAQAMLPVLDRREMRGDAGNRDVFGQPNELALLPDGEPAAIWAAVMARLLAVPQYVAMFQAAFGSTGTPPRFEHAARALAAFQMDAFTTTRSPFDRYLDRDDFALSAAAKRGALLFFGEGRCASCHNGPFLGAQGFANVGAPQLGPGGGREPPRDLGRGEHPDFDAYRFAFRIPPLRNVELTAHYMHSGAYATLEAVVRHYSNVPEALDGYDATQLAPAFRPLYHGDRAALDAMLATLDGRLQPPLEFDDGEVQDLVAFLHSLTDPAARDLSALAPASVPSGLPVR